MTTTPPTPPTPPAVGKARQPFPFQAASAAIGAPIIAFLLGIISPPLMKSSPSAGLIIGSANILLIIAGFSLAIYALVSISKHGRKGLLVHGIVGLLLNGLFLAAFLSFFFMINRPDPRPARLAGTWEFNDTKAAIIQQFEFLSEHKFRVRVLASPSRSVVSDISGTYALSPRDQPGAITFSVTEVTAGDPTLKGAQLVFGLESLNDSMLQLRDKAKITTYSRPK